MEFKLKNKEWEEFFLKTGIEEESASIIVENAIILSKFSGNSILTCIEGLTEIINKFSINPSAVINLLVKKSAEGTSQVFDLLNGLIRSTKEDINIEDYLDLISKMIKATGRSGAVIGNSLKTIFTNLKSEHKIKKLRLLEVDIKNIDKISLVFLNELINKILVLNEEKRVEVEKLISGLYQINSFKSFYKIFQNA